jgi:hypothetical protein
LFAVVHVGWYTTGVNEFDTTPTLPDLVPAYKILKSEGDGVKGGIGLREFGFAVPHRAANA